MELLGDLNMMHDGKCPALCLTRKRVQTLVPASAHLIRQLTVPSPAHGRCCTGTNTGDNHVYCSTQASAVRVER